MIRLSLKYKKTFLHLILLLYGRLIRKKLTIIILTAYRNSILRSKFIIWIWKQFFRLEFNLTIIINASLI